MRSYNSIKNLGCPFHFMVLLCFLIFSSCITPISFEISKEQVQLVVEGRITNEEPPYTVQVSRSLDLSSDTLKVIPEQEALVVLYDNQGNSEVLDEIESGIYQTRGFIQGTIGRSYSIYIQTKSGSEFESTPDELLPAGEIAEIRHQFDERTRLEEFGEVKQDIFKIFIDADGGELENPLIRWRLKSVFEVETYPALNITEVPPYEPLKDPLPCSGYIVDEGPLFSGGILKQVGPCTCCQCWATLFEDIPQLSDQYTVENNDFQNILVGEVPITNYTFHDKVMVEVEQMTLGEKTFDFFKAIRSQKLGAADLFQPQIGQIEGNIVSLDPKNQVLGLFYAGAVSTKMTYLYQEDVPYAVPPITFITNACYDAYLNSTTDKPERWID